MHWSITLESDISGMHLQYNVVQVSSKRLVRRENCRFPLHWSFHSEIIFNFRSIERKWKKEWKKSGRQSKRFKNSIWMASYSIFVMAMKFFKFHRQRVASLTQVAHIRADHRRPHKCRNIIIIKTLKWPSSTFWFTDRHSQLIRVVRQFKIECKSITFLHLFYQLFLLWFSKFELHTKWLTHPSNIIKGKKRDLQGKLVNDQIAFSLTPS